MKRSHIVLGVSDAESSADDSLQRLGCRLDLLIPGKYALQRTDVVNRSIRTVGHKEGGTCWGRVGRCGQEWRCYPAVITWMESSADSACWSHSCPNRSVSGH